MRLSFIYLINLCSLFLIFGTEFLSYFKVLNTNYIFLLWLTFFSVFIFFVIYSKYYQKKKIKFDQNLLLNNKLLLFLIIVILFTTLIISIIFLPSTPDAMSYHLPRVMTWIQNSNINYFPTPDQRMLFMPPFSSFLGLHLYLIFENDFIFNFIQWFSMFFSLIVVTMIAKEMGGNLKNQILSAFFLITLPMGILQSTSTQTDYVVTFWFLSFLLFLLRYKKSLKFSDIIYLSISLGVGLLSKQTMYLYAFPFFIMFIYSVEIKKIKKIIFHLFISVLIIVSINLSHLKRTYHMYDNFTAIEGSNVSATNQLFSGKHFVSNIIRNFSLNLTLPHSNYNETLRNFVAKTHQKLDISLVDSKNTFGKDYYIYFNTYESHAPNTLHFFILLILISTILFRSNYSNYLKIYTICLIIGFLIFCLILKWQPGGNRLLLPLFSAFSILFGFFINKIKSKQIARILIFTLFLWSLPYLFMNKLRPIISYSIEENQKLSLSFDNLNKLIKDPHEFYFLENYNRYIEFNQIADLIYKKKCKNIGITRGYAEYEYPLRHLIKDKFYKTKLQFKYPYVENLSAKFDTDKYENMCAIISFECYDNDINCTTNKIKNLPTNLKPVKIGDRITLFL